MGFKLGNFAIDQILQAVAQDFDDNILYTLDQLSTATIDLSAESQDVKDKHGNLIRKIWKNKTGTFTATNALLNVNVMNASSGHEMVSATSEKTIVMPEIDTVAAGSTITLKDPVEGSVKVIALYSNGANGASYVQSTEASETAFGLSEANVLTPPTIAGDDAPTQYLVKYLRNDKGGIAIQNSSESFPKTIKLTMKASYIDPCDDDLKPCYIYLPSFQVSPETSISLSSDSTEIDYKGDLQVDYCSNDKLLYAIYFPDDSEVDA